MGPQSRSAKDTVLTPALTGNFIYISDDKNVIVIARVGSRVDFTR